MSTTRSLNILLVEDDEIQQVNVRRALENAGVESELFVAADGREALEMLRSGLMPARRLVLLDVHMPRMGGIEFLRAVRNDPALKPLVVVMLTSSEEMEDKREALALSASGYLLKSHNFSKFSEQLRVLDQYWSMKEIP